jgi:hypothetical protein
MAGNESGSPSAMDPERRRFLTWLGVGLSALAAMVVAVPVVGFIVAPLFVNPRDVWRKVGAVSNFEIGKTVKVSFTDPSPMAWAGVTALTAASIRGLRAKLRTPGMPGEMDPEGQSLHVSLPRRSLLRRRQRRGRSATARALQVSGASARRAG